MYYDPVLPWEEPLPRRVAQSTERLATVPTIASLAARYHFDAQVCHLRFLQYQDERVIPSRFDENRDADQAIKRMKTPIRRLRPGSTSTRSSSTRASSATNSSAPNRPQTSSSPRPGSDFSRRNCRLHLGYRNLEEPGELDEIMKRVSRPTTASIGARNLAGKSYDYYTPEYTKTHRPLPNIDTRFMGKKQMNQEEYDALLDRLTKHTKSSHWKVKSVHDPNTHPPRRLPGDYGRY